MSVFELSKKNHPKITQNSTKTRKKSFTHCTSCKRNRTIATAANRVKTEKYYASTRRRGAGGHLQEARARAGEVLRGMQIRRGHGRRSPPEFRRKLGSDARLRSARGEGGVSVAAAAAMRSSLAAHTSNQSGHRALADWIGDWMPPHLTPPLLLPSPSPPFCSRNFCPFGIAPPPPGPPPPAASTSGASA
jgi:hypothetical protein